MSLEDGCDLSDDVEEPKRLEPRLDAKRWLYLLSGNECAFPGCPDRLLNEHGDWVGEHVHIRGVKGERFDPQMSNEERRHRDNLLLMCHAHHVETNDEETWTAERLRQLKREHEARFQRGLETYTTDPLPQDLFDLTRSQPVRHASDLRRMHALLGWSYDEAEAQILVGQANSVLDRVTALTPNSRAVLGTVIDRGTASGGVLDDAIHVLWSELRDVLNVTDERLTEHVGQLDAAGLAGVETEPWEHPGITVYAGAPDANWTAFWGDLRRFLALVDGGRRVTDVLVALDFSVMDSEGG